MKQESTDKRIRTWVSEDGKHAVASMGLGSGGGSASGTKIGAGHKPQPYGWHGYYGETGGGSSTGPVYRGSVRLPNEVRGSVSKEVLPSVSQPEHIPAAVVWKHPEESNELKPQMRETLEGLRTAPEMESMYISSGQRAPLVKGDPHVDGRAVDVSRINGYPVEGLEAAQGPGADKASRAAENMVEQAMKDPNVNQIIGPNGGWNKVDGEWKQIGDAKLLKEHKDHYHINVFRR